MGLLGMYFDAAVVFVTSHTLLFRLALAMLWVVIEYRIVHIELDRTDHSGAGMYLDERKNEHRVLF